MNSTEQLQVTIEQLGKDMIIIHFSKRIHEQDMPNSAYHDENFSRWFKKQWAGLDGVDGIEHYSRYSIVIRPARLVPPEVTRVAFFKAMTMFLERK